MRYITAICLCVLYAGTAHALEFEYSLTGDQKTILDSAKEMAGIFASVGLGLSLIPTIYNIATNNNGKKWLVSWIVALFVFTICYNLFY